MRRTQCRVLAAVALSAAAVLSCRTSPPFAPAAEARELVDGHVGKNRNVGIAVGIHHGDTRWTYGAGHVHAPDGARPDEDTIFEIGSISKVLTGVLLADAVNEGDVTLDTPIETLLPPGVAPRGSKRSITLLDLATHRSGLPRMPANFRPSEPLDPYVDYDAAAMYEALEELRLLSEPGATYAYSNLAVGLLGHSLARATRTPFADLLHDRVLAPAGMSSSGVGFGEESPRLAHVYSGIGKPVRPWRFDVLAAAGAVRSTVRDLLRFGDACLDARSARLRAAIDASREIRVETEPRMGLGWHVMRVDGHDVWWHNGMTGGSASFFALCPAQRLCVVVLSNTARSVDELSIHLVELALQPPR